MRLPGWLPYRIRDWWDSRRIERTLRGLRDTPPVPAVEPDAADVEVHLLLCHRDARIAVVALKSLLRFRDLRACVSLTDDGSLTVADREFLDAHVPGCRWLPPRADDPALTAVLASRPHLARLYAGPYAPARKLLHPLALARRDRVVVLDPDTATFRHPDQLIDWARGGGLPALALIDRRRSLNGVPEAVQTTLAKLGAVVASARPWRILHHFFNSGLLAFRPADLDLDVAERFLAWREAADPSLKAGRPAIWFGDWTPEQTAYLVMFAALDSPAEAFDDGYGLGHGEPKTFRHFLRSGLTDPDTLDWLRRFIPNLRLEHG